MEKTLIGKFEESLNLKPGFFFDLMEEDDWTFIIKMSAFFEAACTQLLITALGKDGLTEVLSYLEIGNQRYGKLTFLSGLSAIDNNAEQFIRKLSEIRNDFVHNISNTNTSIDTYINAMNQSKKADYIRALTSYLSPTMPIAGKDVMREEIIILHPKMAISIAGYACLSDIMSKKQDYQVVSSLVGIALNSVSKGASGKEPKL